MKPSLPLSTGVCLKPQHFDFILEEQPDIGWLEIHPENYMSAGGPHHYYLSKLCERYPLSMHGVGMSLGSSTGIDEDHLRKLKRLVDLYQPAQVSEHLAWSHWNEIFLNDLLPLPYTHESLNVMCTNIDKVQSTLNKNILIENPSVYIEYSMSDYDEPDFLNELCLRTGCELLVDVNNIAVSAFNNNFNPLHYINKLPLNKIGEVHLAGHTVKPLHGDKVIRIDDHGSKISAEVWSLLESLLSLSQRKLPLLVEWDTDIPSFDILLGEAQQAQHIMQRACGKTTTDLSAC